MTDDVIVHVRHIREAKLCSRGARMWFTRHGLDFTAFLTHGIPASQIDNLGDALGKQVAQIARDEAAEDRQ